MDPITTAIVAGASDIATGYAKEAIKDGYKALRDAVLGLFKSETKTQAEAALTAVEQAPQSKAAQTALSDLLAAAGALKDARLVALAANHSKALNVGGDVHGGIHM